MFHLSEFSNVTRSKCSRVHFNGIIRFNGYPYVKDFQTLCLGIDGN